MVDAIAFADLVLVSGWVVPALARSEDAFVLAGIAGIDLDLPLRWIGVALYGIWMELSCTPITSNAIAGASDINSGVVLVATSIVVVAVIAGVRLTLRRLREVVAASPKVTSQQDAIWWLNSVKHLLAPF